MIVKNKNKNIIAGVESVVLTFKGGCGWVLRQNPGVLCHQTPFEIRMSGIVLGLHCRLRCSRKMVERCPRGVCGGIWSVLYFDIKLGGLVKSASPILRLDLSSFCCLA